MKDDFPAAHSMDSQWFAVDRNGCVAVFDTGEPGPVPVDATSGQGLSFEVMDLLAAGSPGISYDMSDVLIPDGKVFNGDSSRKDLTGAKAADINALKPPLFSCILWFSTDAALQAAALNEAKRLPMQNAIVVSVEMVTKPQWDELVRQLKSGSLQRAWINAYVTLARFGFFEYDYEDYQAKDPYKQFARPRTPIQFGQLPQSARDRIGKFELKDKDFSRDREISPDDCGECHRWG